MEMAPWARALEKIFGRARGEFVGRRRIPAGERELRIERVLEVGLIGERAGDAAPRAAAARNAQRRGRGQRVAARCIAHEKLAVGCWRPLPVPPLTVPSTPVR